MGKKLSSYEKSRREREKRSQQAANQRTRDIINAEKRAKTAARKEKEREASKKATEQRRLNARKEKEAKLKKSQDFGENLANTFDELLSNTINLSAENRDITALDNLGIPSKFKILSYFGDLKFTDLVLKLSKKDFKQHTGINHYEKLANTSFEVFKSEYGNFLDNLIGKTARDHQNLIEKSNSKVVKLKSKDDNRLTDFEKSITKHNEALAYFNKASNSELKKVNIDRKNNFDLTVKEIEKFNKTLSDLKKEIGKGFNLNDKNKFSQLFSLNLPIKFESNDSRASYLIRSTKELNNDFYSSPTKNLKYGIKFISTKICLVLSYDEGYFPFPAEKQINDTVNSFSVRPLTKKSKTIVEKNLIAGAALLYALYGFNTLVDNNELDLIVLSNKTDASTGSDYDDVELSLKFKKEEFIKLNFDKITPSETIKLFVNKSDVKLDGIQWFNKNTSDNEFAENIKELIKTKKHIDTNLNTLETQVFSPDDGLNEVNKTKELLFNLIDSKISEKKVKEEIKKFKISITNSINTIRVVIRHLFFGFGFRYLDKSVKRGRLYSFLGLYGWFSVFNVFLNIFSDLADFHNKNDFGAISILISWFIVYVIGYIDLFLYIRKLKRENRYFFNV
jgi:hypothetical protein